MNKARNLAHCLLLVVATWISASPALFLAVTAAGSAPPPPAPKPGFASVYIGAGLEGIADWSFSNAFADLVRQSRGFHLADTPWDGNVPLSPAGWPMSDFGVVLGVWDGMHGVGGTYKIRFKCSKLPTIELAASPGEIKNLKRDPATSVVTADLVYPENGSQLMLSFRGTGSGVTDLQVMRPGYAFSTVFTTPFLNHLARFPVLRFMDWTSTNGNPSVAWSDRIPGKWPYYGDNKWVPWETCIALANRLKKDIWINVPHKANDAYVTSLAKLIKSSLDSSLKVYVEYSNEVWNWGFEQATWNADQAKADVAAGDPDLNFDKVNDSNIWTARRIGKRIRRISAIFASQFGNRVRPVLGTQVAWPAYWLVEALKFMDMRFGPPSKYLYAVAVAPYFNLGDADQRTDLTVVEVLAALNNSATAYATDLNLEACATLAYSYGLKLTAYEGGPDTFGPNNIASKHAASMDPRMRPVMAGYLRTMFSYGFALFNIFVAGATNYDSQYGTWGLTDDMTHQNAPKILAINDLNSAKYVALGQGTLLPGTVDARKYAMRDANWATSDVLQLSSTDWMGPARSYLVRSNTQRRYSFTLRASANTGGVATRIELWVNNVKAGTFAIPNSGDAVVSTGAVAAVLPMGLSGFRLKLVAGSAVKVVSIVAV